MPPSRFASVSKWRNVLLSPAEPDQRYHELVLAPPPDSGSFVGVTSDWIVTKAARSGFLILLPHDMPGRYAKQPPSYHASAAPVSDFAVSHFHDGLLAVGAEGGTLTLHKLPSSQRSATGGFPPALADTPELLASIQARDSAQTVSSIEFHPTSSNLIAASSRSSIDIYDLHSARPAISLDAPSSVLSIDWSQDGVTLASAAKDGIVSLFDARSSATPVSSVRAHASKIKPTRLTFVRSHLVTTGFSAMREREWAVWDPRALQTPVKRGVIDTSTGIVSPLVDHNRGLVYLVGKGDATLRWLEVDEASAFTEGNCPLNFTIGGGGIAPSTIHRVMEGEVDRLILASTASEDCLVPVSVTIPRRHYIDFHPDLYPPTSSRVAAQSGADWLAGKDAAVQLVSQDPALAATERQKVRELVQHATEPSRAVAAGSAPSMQTSKVPVEQLTSPPPSSQPTPVSTSMAALASAASSSEPRRPELRAEPKSKGAEAGDSEPATSTSAAAPANDQRASVPPAADQDVPVESKSFARPASSQQPISRVSAGKITAVTPNSAVTAAPAPASAPARASQRLPTLKRSVQPQTAAAKGAPRWSRRFLLGSTPLTASHQNLSGLDFGMPPDGRMLAANDRFLLFPLAGPGGRIGVHPVKETGRIPTLVPALTASSKLIDFALDPLDPERAASVHEDAAIRVWRLPMDGQALAEQTIDTPEQLLSWKGAGKQSELAFHPTAKDLLATCSPERGGGLLLWNLASPSSDPIAIPVEGDGATSLVWSPGGAAVALSCKDKAIRMVSSRQQRMSDPSSKPSTDSSVSASAEEASKAFLERSVAFAKHRGQPHVTLTFAQSTDGKIAGEGKQQLALSGKESMLMTHTLRTLHDGILVGIGTVLNDNPQLNARLLSSPPPVDRLPRPIVLDSSLRTPVDCKLLQNARNGLGCAPLIVCLAPVSPDVDERRQALEKAGAEIVQLSSSDDGKQLDWQETLAALSQHGIERLMVEGGAAVIDSLMGRQDLVDTLLVTVAPRTVGEHGFGFSAPVPYPCPGAPQQKDDDQSLRVRAEEKFGPDRVIVWDQSASHDQQQQADRGSGVARSVGDAFSVATLCFSDLRNCRLTWIDDRHLAVVGHTVGSARQLRLIEVDGSKLTEKSRLTLDVSPALLFPSYDPDTNVVWLWSKGERLISTYEVRVEEKEPFTALSTFQHQQPQLGVAFLAKKDVDPRKVEIAVSYRIEKGEIRRVSWAVPRLRPEYFQEDIFVPTRDTSEASTTASRWLNGEPDEREPSYLDLRPDDMEPLSKAPDVKKESKLPKGPIVKELTEDERKEKLLDGIFKRAKHRGGTAFDPVVNDEEEQEEEELPIGSAAKRAPDDGDWSD